ncbi:MAG TPA: hypothetical protein DCG53_02940 [Syntrophus sp. (in: bacteria)]|nr:hypothetical protein [Syntrophus sp. (in: bacteria)]
MLDALRQHGYRFLSHHRDPGHLFSPVFFGKNDDSGRRVLQLMIKETAAGVLLALKVLPRSSRCAIIGPHGDALKIKVTSPPLEGRANE